MRRVAGALPPSAPMLIMVIVLPFVLLAATTAVAVPSGPGWSIRAVAQPTNLAQADSGYALVVTNVGSRPTRVGAPVTISDTLPKHVRAVNVLGRNIKTGVNLECSLVPVQCVGAGVGAGETLVINIGVALEAGTPEPEEINFASVSGGGAPTVTTTDPAVFSSASTPFEIENFALQAFDDDGLSSIQAGGHPYALATSLYFSSETSDLPVEEVKDVIVDLPPGLVGDPRATPKCPLNALLENSGISGCPPDSRVGTVVFEAYPSRFRISEGGAESETTAVYNIVPEPGFPAEFGFTYLGKPVIMYASSVRIGGQLRLRVTVPGIPELDTLGVTLLFFGDPGEHFGEAVSSAPPAPFFTNPVDCEAAPVGELTATAEVDTWQHPGYYHVRKSEVVTYPQLAGCDMLQFHPTLTVQPETTQADEPSGYSFTVLNTQNESPFTPGTPELKNATVTLPAGVSLSPSAAGGLRSCAATGPEGINIGSGEAAVPPAEGAQDLGDPQATEPGSGYPGGRNPTSPYDDGLYHTAPGHCPAASTVGSVEIETPLLESPLEGHVYVAQPGCGGSGQSPCGDEDALDGNLFGIYLEAAGSGAIIKLAGSVSVNPATGRITTSFDENPQLPFSALRLRFDGGPRAPLANPQVCGPATTSADFSAWSSPTTPDSDSLSPFTVDWDDVGDACPATLPLTPSMTAETTNPTAGAFSPFSFTLSRGDRQQYLSQLSVTTPPGLLAMISSVPLCDEPLAAEGRCLATSEIGTVTVAAGAGSHPFWVTGHVYLTGSYNGAPFGLSIVVPAQAGPFNLGNVVVRSAITVNPVTSAVTITSGPLPQVIDGIPLRVQTVNVYINRQGFIFNPTNCEAKQVAVTVAGAQGALAQVSSPFAASGCRSLSFAPTFTVSTQAKTSKSNGASLDVKFANKPGAANTKSVTVTLPRQLPARLTTIQQACLAATFAANPAACPAGSLIGVVKARTLVLSTLVSGPAYLVSYGNAAFPDVVMILQGDGVRVDLTGSISIAKGGITSSTLADVPDVPVTDFELSLPEGPHSALATNLPAKARGNFCGAKLTMPTTITAQNGLQVKQSTKVTVGGCPKSKKKAKNKAKMPLGRASPRGGGSRG
jgi:hypothetical protein